MYTIDFCHKSKEQWQKIAEMQIMLQNVNKFSDVENFFKNYVFEKTSLPGKFY
jgi:hypothetical protein